MNPNKSFLITLFILAPLLSASLLMYGQDTDEPKYEARIYNSRIMLKSQDKGSDGRHYYSKVTGSITDIRDSSISLRITDWQDRVHTNKSYYLRDIPISQIDHIKIRQKGRVGTGMLLGSVPAILIGFLIGYNTTSCQQQQGQYFDFCGISRTINGVKVGLIGAVIGAGIGGAIGSNSIYIAIKGDQSRYVLRKELLKRFTE